MIEKKTFVYELSEVLRYTPEGEGDFKETLSIEFSGPTMDVQDSATELSELVTRAFVGYSNMARDTEESDSTAMKTPSSSELKVLLMGANSVSFRDIGKAFIRLACDVGKLDEKTRIKPDHFKKLELDDFNDMVCGYIANFIFPSVFAEGEVEATG
jgi:hypothetical protein